MKNIKLTVEEMKEKFIADGWIDVSFSEMTEDEAKEKGYLFAIDGIKQGQKYFKMNETGDIYNNKGEIVFYNVKAVNNH